MARLIYNAMASLDGYTADETGNFDWAAPSVEVHEMANEQARGIGTHLLGRRMWEVMRYWDTVPTEADGAADHPDVELGFARAWQASDRIVFSRTLREADVEDPRTRIERELDPELVRGLKAAASADLSIAGAELAGQALRAGLVDELQLFVVPVIIGGGKRALPDALRLDLELIDERRFEDGVTFLAYRVRPPAG